MINNKIQYLKYLIVAIFVVVMSGFVYEYGIEYFHIQEHNQQVQLNRATQQIEHAKVHQQNRHPVHKETESKEIVETKISVHGVMDLELNERTSWTTIAKILVTILGTWLGIRLINHVFRRLERV